MPGVNTKQVLIIVAAVVAVIAAGLAVLEVSGTTAILSGNEAADESTSSAAADGSGDVNPVRAKWVIEENRKPGTNKWRLTGPLNEGNIEGYSDSTSATHGESVKLFVSTDAPSYVVEAYRMGHYGGTQARLVWRSDRLPGRRQAKPVIDDETNMVEARWQPSLTVTIDKSWPPGDYLFKLDASNGYGQYIPLVVRDDASKAAVVVMNAVTTWQAYNTWGGHSLYEGSSSGGYGAQGRAKVVSFDRPYKNDSGSGDFLGNELPMISFVESLGLDVTYITNIDLHERPQVLDNHNALVTLGHDEYWTLEMRRAVEGARNSGTNVIFFGANAVFRAIRLEPSAGTPSRREVNYRSAREDPLYGVDNSRVTVSWRDPPLNNPESKLIGTYYECNPVKADMVIADSSAWVFEGTNMKNGDRIVDMVGPEYDRYTEDAPSPPGNVQILAHSPLTCRGKSSYSDMTYYSTASGAGVLGTGTNWWVSKLGPECRPPPCDNRVRTITENVLKAFAVGPVGRAHPSEDNYDEVTARARASSSTTSTRRGATTTTTIVDELPSVPEPPPLPFPTTPPLTSSVTTRPTSTSRTTAR
ncbi:MAG: hypothetical protein M3179_09530 [Actinomycetota bacterium]|nr:hypothetical protein [Actinomycetota bacterium]